MADRTSVRRPVGVTLLVVLGVINGLLTLIGGILLVAWREDADMLRETGESSDVLLTTGVILIVLGLIYLAVARGLAHGNGFARFLVGLNSFVTLAGGAWLAFAREGQLQTQGIVSAVVALIILLLLYSPGANAFFRSR